MILVFTLIEMFKNNVSGSTHRKYGTVLLKTLPRLRSHDVIKDGKRSSF